ncbi:hypothetical protein QA447_11130 [Pseudomonas sp. abacavir_1]
MTDKTTQEEMNAAKQEMNKLLHEMVIAPLKGDLPALLDEALYPLYKDAKERNDSVMAQLSKIRRTLERHYPPDHNVPLVEQLQALADAQSETEIQVRSQTERWGQQVEALAQQTLQAIHSQNDALAVLLDERLLVLRPQIQDRMKQLGDDYRTALCQSSDRLFERLQRSGSERLKRFETLSAAVATAISESLAQREQHLQASFAAQTAGSKAQYDAILEAFSTCAQGLIEQRDQISDLQSKLQRSSLYGKVLLCSCLPLGIASLALLAYLLVRFG